MARVTRIIPEETFQKLRAGRAMLVCAYVSEEQCSNPQLDGAIFQIGRASCRERV